MPSTAAIAAEKIAMREVAKLRRAHIPEAIRAAGARAVAAHGLGFAGVPPPAIVSGFFGIGDEIDTGPMFVRLIEDGYRLALPVMNGRDKPLLFRAYRPGDPLVSRVWGIKEPADQAALVNPQIVLSALLAFDAAGWRLGWGGGYFDRSIRQLRQSGPLTTIGLAFDEQRVDAVPHLDYDEPLDWVLTPSGPRRCHR